MTLEEHNRNQQDQARDRLAEMAALREEGKTLEHIAKSYGITRQRVHQLMVKARRYGI